MLMAVVVVEVQRTRGKMDIEKEKKIKKAADAARSGRVSVLFFYTFNTHQAATLAEAAATAEVTASTDKGTS